MIEQSTTDLFHGVSSTILEEIEGDGANVSTELEHRILRNIDSLIVNLLAEWYKEQREYY
ncbi:MAG: hypothetical protein GY762_03580 [Proteobacteria bacterium]|nr:hypothetical protein [Pseudomonadota bacterium]